MIPELKKELINGEHPFYQYECGHLTDDSYPLHGIIPVGRYANMLICKHCWQSLRDRFLVDFFSEMIRNADIDDSLRVMLTALIIRTKDHADGS